MLCHQSTDEAEIKLRLQLTIQVPLWNDIFQTHNWMLLKLFSFPSQHGSPPMPRYMLYLLCLVYFTGHSHVERFFQHAGPLADIYYLSCFSAFQLHSNGASSVMNVPILISLGAIEVVEHCTHEALIS